MIVSRGIPLTRNGHSKHKMMRHTMVCESMPSLSVCPAVLCFDDVDKSPPGLCRYILFSHTLFSPSVFFTPSNTHTHTIHTATHTHTHTHTYILNSDSHLCVYLVVWWCPAPVLNIYNIYIYIKRKLAVETPRFMQNVKIRLKIQFRPVYLKI